MGSWLLCLAGTSRCDDTGFRGGAGTENAAANPRWIPGRVGFGGARRGAGGRVRFLGAGEVLGALGLLQPAATRIRAVGAEVTEGNDEPFVFRREAGTWRIHRDLFATNQPRA